MPIVVMKTENPCGLSKEKNLHAEGYNLEEIYIECPFSLLSDKEVMFDRNIPSLRLLEGKWSRTGVNMEVKS